MRNRLFWVGCCLPLIAHAELNDSCAKQPLLKAANLADMRAMEALLPVTTNLDYYEEFGMTALKCAVASGKLAPVKRLVDAGANVNAYGEGPALLSAFHGLVNKEGQYLSIIEFLLESGANVDWFESHFTYNFEGRAGNALYFFATTNSSRMLYDHQMFVGDMYDFYKEWRDRQAIARQDALAVWKALIDRVKDVNQKTIHGVTALMQASQTSGPEEIQMLLDAGADLEAVDNQGRTAIFYAAYDINTLKLLIDRGAKVNVHDKHGNSTLLFVSQPESVALLIAHGVSPTEKNNNDDTALHQLLLLPFCPSTNCFPDVSPNPDKDTFCVYGVYSRNWDVTKNTIIALIQAGVDVNAKNKQGKNLLDAAEDGSYYNKAPELLKSLGAVE